MAGMCNMPKGISRSKEGHDHPPTWHKVWYSGDETGYKKVLLGRSERLLGHMQHKFYPQDGTWPKQIQGWTKGAIWLLECWLGAQARADVVSTIEDEEVTEHAE